MLPLGAAPLGNKRLNVLLGLLSIGSCCEARERDARLLVRVDADLERGQRRERPLMLIACAMCWSIEMPPAEVRVGHLFGRHRVAMPADVRVRGRAGLHVGREHVEPVDEQQIFLYIESG